VDTNGAPSSFLNLVPFLVPQKVTDGYPMGRGIIRIVTVATANANESIIHNLGRIPNFVLILDPGTVYVQWKRGTVAWTVTTISLQFSAAGTFTIWVV
jgi:hypothetical protein